MSNAMLTQLLYCFCVLSALLLAGTLLRGCIPVFRKLFLPASVIGGFIGLLIGPIIWKGGGIPFPKEWITTWSVLPGILIVPVVASVPLGVKFGKSNKSTGKTSTDVIKTFGIFLGVAAFQLIIAIAVRQFFVSGGMDIYAPFGYELPMGFSGGHGTAGVIGSYYKGLDLPYWELAQGVTTTTATFGLIGGMIIGIVAINVAARAGQTAILTKPGDIPPDMAKGYQMDPAKQPSLGKETTMSSSIESLTFHLSVILTACGLAYVLLNLVKYLRLPLISQVPIWAWAIVVMFGVNFCIQKAGLGNLIDDKTKSRIAGVCTDYAIVAAIASLPVQAIMVYIVPILTMVLLGYVGTYVFLHYLFKKFFADFHFERFISLWGTSTGVFLTGLMLLKICDPEYKSPVLNDFSMSFSLTSVTSFILMPIVVSMLLYQSFAMNVLFQFGLLVIGMILLLGADHISRKLKVEG
jgi:ESS family glutamate:Na+ symporter